MIYGKNVQKTFKNPLKIVIKKVKKALAILKLLWYDIRVYVSLAAYPLIWGRVGT